jgi:hypothetical protein
MKHLPLKAGGAQTALLAGPAQLLRGAPDSREPGGAPSRPVEAWEYGSPTTLLTDGSSIFRS